MSEPVNKFESVVQSLREFFCDEWGTIRSNYSITFIRDTGDHKESIKVSDDGLWNITIKIMDREREIRTVASYNAHHKNKVLPEYVPIIDRTFAFMMKRISEMESISLPNFHFGTVVEKEHCNITKPHNHFYVTEYVSFRTMEPDIIIPILKTRYNFFNEYSNIG